MTRSRPALRLLAAAAAALLPAAAACGVRGSPRAPLRIVPRAITDLEATRIGGRVYVEFTVPDRDTADEGPGDIDRVEVYALTTQPTRLRPRPAFSDDWLEAATLIAELTVRAPDAPPLGVGAPPLAGAAAAPAGGAGGAAPAVDAASGPPGAAAADGDPAAAGAVRAAVDRAAAVTVIDPLAPAAFAPMTVGDPDDEPAPDEPDPAARAVPRPLASPPPPDPLIRSYAAFAVSSRNRPGDPSPLVDVPLAAPPPPPSGPPVVTWTADTVRIDWTAPPTVRRPVQALEAVPPILASTPVVSGPAPSAYAVYDLAAGVDPASVRPTPLAAPAADPWHEDPAVAFGAVRCYAVRVQDAVPGPAPGGDSLVLLGDASPAACVLLTDTFPPAAPTGLLAVADAAGISLAWDRNAEPDLAGYLVLRRAASDATLHRLTVEPIGEAAYRDVDVVPGARYVYTVRALDTAAPANASPPSAPAAVSAR